MRRMPMASLPRDAVRCTTDGHQENRQTQGELERNSGKRDEGTEMDLGILEGCCSRRPKVGALVAAVCANLRKNK